MKRMVFAVISAVILISLIGCGSNEKSQLPAEFSDAAYGEEPFQNMNIILPAKEKANGGVIMLIHGGAWIEGDKVNGYTDGFINKFRDSGYIISTVNYRPASESSDAFDMLGDIKLALNYIKKISENKGLAADRAMLIGWSSGGHLAELYAYSMADAADIKVTCVTAYSGIADLTDSGLYIDNPLDEILNRPMTEVLSCLCGYKLDVSDMSESQKYLEKASPIFYANTAVPTIICHSEIDTYVNYQTAVSLKERLEACQIDCSFIDFPASGHDLLLDPDSLALSYETVSEYAQRYLCAQE